MFRKGDESMGKIELIIADRDPIYLEYFSNFIRTTDFSDKFILKSFSRKESLEEYLKSQSRVDILLVQSNLFPNYLSAPEGSTMIYLTDDDKGLEDTDILALYKYQPLNQLLSIVRSHYLENKNYQSSRASEDSRTQVIAIYSGMGGSGKTTTALNIARQMASVEKKVLYLNFELLNSTGLLFPTEEGNHFTRILYYLKSNTSQLMTKIEELKRHDLQTRIDYFERLHNPEEMLDMTKEDVKVLLDTIVSMDYYDLVILDLESSTHERIVSALINSDYIFWLLQDDVQCLEKNRLLLAEYERLLDKSYSPLINKTKFVMNRYTGKLANNLREYGFVLDGYLPYIPEWKTVNQFEQLMKASFFNKEAVKLLDSLKEQRRRESS
jgi:cellulose biosynthesis protein BcsQ